MQRWWTKKYNLPWNHNLFESRTKFDLLTEYYLDVFEQNPLEAHRQADGEIQFKNTGDPYVDKWEEQIARGEIPTLTEAFTPEELKAYLRLREKSRGLYTQARLSEAIDEAPAKIPSQQIDRAKREALARQQMSKDRTDRTFGED